MAENVLRRANVGLLSGDQKTTERMPQVVKSKSLPRRQVHHGLHGGGPWTIATSKLPTQGTQVEISSPVRIPA